MPTNRHKTNPTKPWHARVRLNRVAYSLGYYFTEQEALDAESAFRRDNGMTTLMPNTTRYETVMQLRNQGMTDREIAEELGLAPATIRSITSVYNRRNANAH